VACFRVTFTFIFPAVSTFSCTHFPNTFFTNSTVPFINRCSSTVSFFIPASFYALTDYSSITDTIPASYRQAADLNLCSTTVCVASGLEGCLIATVTGRWCGLWWNDSVTGCTIGWWGLDRRQRKRFVRSTGLRSPLFLTELHVQRLQNALFPRVKRPVRESNPNITQVAKLIKRGVPSAVGTEWMVPQYLKGKPGFSEIMLKLWDIRGEKTTHFDRHSTSQMPLTHMQAL